jgi:hypothetical protein
LKDPASSSGATGGRASILTRKRITIGAIVLLILAIAGYLLVRRFVAIAPAGARVVPRGVWAVAGNGRANEQVFVDATYGNPTIAGVAARVGWLDLEPREGEFHWQLLDAVFAKAEAQRKAVILILVPGFDSPGWALAGAQTAQFQRQYGPGAGQTGVLPLPWDETYLTRWFAFLRQVSQRYGDRPSFRMVAAAGPTSVSAEMSLPNSAAEIRQWQSLAYTPAKYVAAWRQTFQEYSSLFPRQYVSLALYPGLPIDDQGKSDNSERIKTRQAVIDEGLRFRDQFALQTSGLDGVRQEDLAYDLVTSLHGQVVTGFQMSTAATARPAPMGDANDPVHALDLAVQHGLAANADFLEIYEPDIQNPALQPLLQRTAQSLAK